LKSSRSYILFILLFFLYPTVWADEEMPELRLKFKQAEHDTTRIRALFGMGNLFIEGPSDSLIFYYEKALVFIEKNYKNFDPSKDVGTEPFETFRDQKIRALIEFGIEYFFRSDYTRSLEYYFQALSLVEELGDIGLLSECYSEIGIVYKNQGNFDQALEYYENALEFAKQISDSSWIASCKVNMGNVYKEKGYLIIAQNYYLEALKTLERLGHDRRVSACYQNIGDIYGQQLDFNSALEYYSRSLEIAIETNDNVRETTCYLNIGYVYLKLKEYIVARDYFNKALGLYEASGYSHELDDCYILIGDTYNYEDNYNEAMNYYNQALEISQGEMDNARIAEVLAKLGSAYFKKESFSRAITLTNQSLELARELGSINLIIDAHKTLSEIYDAIEMPDKSLLEYKEFSRLKDSLFNAEKYKAIKEMEVKYDSEEKEQQLVLLEEKNQVQVLTMSRRNRVYVATLIGIGLLFIIGYILFRNHQLKTKHRAVELEQKLMRSQMNPHFIFNSLIAIQSYIYKKDPVKAGDYLAKFADLIRITLDSTRAEFVTFEKELKMLNVYLELQNLRFENIFEYQIIEQIDLEHSTVKIPPMMAQPFIENSIEHGLRHKKGKGFVKISFSKTDHKLTCVVEDDGIGRERSQSMEKTKNHQSMATSITKERLEILSKKYKRKFTLEIVDLKDDAGQPLGTRVEFDIPLTINEN